MTISSRAPEAAALTALAEDVHAFVQPDGGWCLNNAGLVTGGGRGVLIDTAATRTRAERLRQAVERVLPGGPDLVVNTHFHGDHHFGNCLFAPAATVVAQEDVREQILRAGLDLQRIWPGVGWGEIELVAPTLTFRESLTLHLGELTVELRDVGPAHTSHDVVAWVPERGVLFTGDVAWSGVTPFCLMGSIDGSLSALETLRAYGATTVVPGHGSVGGPEILDATEAYLRWLKETARQGHKAGRTPLEAAREAELGEFARLLDPERLVGNLHRAYAELDGAPAGAELDIVGPFGEMAAYHGGLPDCHA